MELGSSSRPPLPSGRKMPTSKATSRSTLTTAAFYSLGPFSFLNFLQRSRSSSSSSQSLAVWNPISGDWLELPKSSAPDHLCSIKRGWNAALLCASNPRSACDSIDCHLGHFLVVFMTTFQHRAYVFVYSSQSGSWSEPTSATLDPLGPDRRLYPTGLSALAGNAVYFKVFSDLSVEILKYDLGTQEISSVNLPPDLHKDRQIMLITTEYGGLGIARVERSSRLHLWSRESGAGGHLGWSSSGVIELSTLLPTNAHSIHEDAFVHGLGAFLVSTGDGVFSVDLESNQASKVCEADAAETLFPIRASALQHQMWPLRIQGRDQVQVYRVHEELKFVAK